MFCFTENENYAELGGYFREKIDHLWKRNGRRSYWFRCGDFTRRAGSL